MHLLAGPARQRGSREEVAAEAGENVSSEKQRQMWRERHRNTDRDTITEGDAGIPLRVVSIYKLVQRQSTEEKARK